MQTRAKDLFADMETRPAPSGQPGALERRLLSNNPCDFFVGVKKPENTRFLRVGFMGAQLTDIVDLPQFRGMDVRREETDLDGRRRIVLQLSVSLEVFNDVFSALVDDIQDHVAEVATTEDTARAVLGRLSQWHRFLESYVESGLDKEHQLGLFGEVWYLRDQLIPTLGPSAAITAWTGPNATAKDFQVLEGGIEVKTTLALPPYVVRISNERQLDNQGLRWLRLVHISVDTSPASGESLPGLVASVRGLLSSNVNLAHVFEDKLRAAAYWEEHSAKYAGTCYVVRFTNTYEVRSDFPRIIEHHLPKGVGSVSYDLAISNLEEFLIAALSPVPEA